MTFQGYDDIARGTAKGFSCYMVHAPGSNETLQPAYSAVTTTAEFDAVVAQLGAHVQLVLADLTAQSGRAVETLTIGKTFVTKFVRGRRFSITDSRTWRMDGPRSRWNTRYKKQPFNCDGLVVFTGMCAADVPPALAAHRMNHEQLALTYEDHLTEWLRTRIGNTAIKNEDAGGGGRRARQHAGFVLYMAFRFAPAAQ